MPEPSHPEFEIDEDLRWQRGQWRVQRVGWWAFAAIIVGGLLGVFGHGWLSSASRASDDGSLVIRYERLIRSERPVGLTFVIQAQEPEVRIWLSSDYLRSVDVESITPQPDSVELAQGRYIFVFSVDSTAVDVPITFLMEAHAPGVLSIHAGLVDGAELSFRQFVYP